MRTTIFCGTSVDGFIARLNHTFDFLSAGGEVTGEDNGFTAFMATVDAIVMGRNTYDVVLPFDTWPYGKTPVHVLTHRPIEAVPAGAVVERVSGPPAAVLAQLADRGLEHVYVDGGATIQQFLRAGLIDRLVVTRVPVLIGTGISLFGELDGDILLEHVATTVIAGGAVQSEYLTRRRPQ